MSNDGWDSILQDLFLSVFILIICYTSWGLYYARYRRYRSSGRGILKSAGPFTVFAPTDEAFAKLPAGTLEAVLADKAKLAAILTYHVVAGKVMAADVVGMHGKVATTVQGSGLHIDTTHGVKVGTATVTKTDIVCSNGVIHIIDSVLIPS
jgi:uncharacterized surface protein with fasciclin (FAS1) repeats